MAPESQNDPTSSSVSSNSKRPAAPTQLSDDLPGTTTYLTGHDAGGRAVVHSARPGSWKPFGDEGKMGFNQIYTNRFPADLNDEADVAFHEDIISGGKMGLATRGGVVCRMVDFAPLYECSECPIILPKSPLLVTWCIVPKTRTFLRGTQSLVHMLFSAHRERIDC